MSITDIRPSTSATGLSRWASARASVRDRRATRALYKQVERELSTYTTAADLQELEAMLERSPGNDESVFTHVVENIRLRAA